MHNFPRTALRTRGEGARRVRGGASATPYLVVILLA